MFAHCLMPTPLKKFVDVILPLPLAQSYTYSLPESIEARVQTGCRVVVPFGRKKFYTAIVKNVHYAAPEGYETKEVMDLLDESPILLPAQFQFWNWLSDYYLCTEGDVYKAAVPSGMKLESETLVLVNPDFEADAPLSGREQLVFDKLGEHSPLSVTQLEKECGLKNLLPVIRVLLEKEAIFVKEELKRSYKPKTEPYIRLAPTYCEEQTLRNLFDDLSRAPKQLALLMKYLELSGFMGKSTLKEVSKKLLLEKSTVSMSVLKGLQDKGIFQTYLHEVGRLSGTGNRVEAVRPLSRAQQQTYQGIVAAFQEKQVCLLHGVTSSGKTEIYIHLIDEVLRSGKQVLYLLPEIALTTQITERLLRVFGDKLGVYHSKYPDAERVEIWRKQLGDAPFQVILGVRSSVFLPFQNLGLVIVDEEHEATYKQQDPAPRYHARNAAIVLASMYKAHVLLGTATPCLESYSNALNGKYGLVELKERYQEIRMPEILPVDIKDLAKRKQMHKQFSPLLLEKIQNALEAKEQVILFQNRRGFSPMMECRVCGWVPRCKNCDVSLTYHRGINQLTCHYCGATYAVPHECPACGGTEIISRGFGTEKVEEDFKEFFPDARIARMDLDTTRTRAAYERIIDDFQVGKTDVLIGTQMVSKGLDFDRVSVVGILNADSLLNYPDFRAYERAFQMMAQVSGRAGRNNKQGLVVLQTKSMEHPIIAQVMNTDFEGMYRSQMEERSAFGYPPYCRLIYVYLKHHRQDVLDKAATAMAGRLREIFGRRILGPDNPPVARIQTLYIKKIVVKIEVSASMMKVRELLRQVQREIQMDEHFRSLLVYYDVDPM